ncbi:MAG: hypothetical protein M3214_11940 [Actinomycetota bacterium]|nr:hypothetical protein [Actinomycetota bacterium]
MDDFRSRPGRPVVTSDEVVELDCFRLADVPAHLARRRRRAAGRIDMALYARLAGGQG